MYVLQLIVKWIVIFFFLFLLLGVITILSEISFTSYGEAKFVFKNNFLTPLAEISDLELLSEREGFLPGPNGCAEIRFKARGQVLLKDHEEFIDSVCFEKLPSSGVLLVPKETPLSEFKCLTAKPRDDHPEYIERLSWHPGSGVYYFILCS